MAPVTTTEVIDPTLLNIWGFVKYVLIFNTLIATYLIYKPLQASLHPPHLNANATSHRHIRQRLALIFLGLANLGLALSYHLSSCPVSLVLTWPNTFNALVVGSWVYMAYDNFLLAWTLRMDRGCICDVAVSGEKNSENQGSIEDDEDEARERETTPLLHK